MTNANTNFTPVTNDMGFWEAVGLVTKLTSATTGAAISGGVETIKLAARGAEVGAQTLGVHDQFVNLNNGSVFNAYGVAYDLVGKIADEKATAWFKSEPQGVNPELAAAADRASAAKAADAAADAEATK